MPTPRMRKVNSVLREVLADEIERLTDPRVEMVSVTGVETSPDLRRAIVYISTLDLERGEEAVAALNRAAPRLQGAVARQVRMKYTPHLEFALDTGVVHGDRIDSILRRIATEDPTPEEE
ncbi:MAG TPA: 30S ribosome-binding factor RbfA [Acidimicrobiia bacterium]|nr:30S ribosome-binding factor RbfA [Acidimicrobiia bacterium]